VIRNDDDDDDDDDGNNNNNMSLDLSNFHFVTVL
jgi:hypothetical protein